MSDVGAVGGGPVGYTFVEIRPHATRFNAQAAASVSPGLAAIDKAFDIRARSIEGRLQEVGKKATVAFSLPAALGLGAAVKAASSLEEQGNKVRVVFGQATKSVEDFAGTASDRIGLSERAAKQAAGTFGNLFRAVGIGEEMAARMSAQLIKRAVDVGSLSQAQNEEVLTAFRAGLVGEQEPLRRFGANLNEARLKQEALNLGLFVGKGVLDGSAKAQAAYSLILKDTALAAGDFERTSGSLANQLKTLGAKGEEAAASLGEKLIPMAVQLAEAGVKVLDVFEAMPGPVKNLAAIGTVATAAAGPVIFLTGKVIQLRKALVGLQAQSTIGAIGKSAAASAAGSTAGSLAGNSLAGNLAGGVAGGAATSGLLRAGLSGARFAGTVGLAATGVVTLARAANEAVPALKKLDEGVIGFEEKIPVIGKLLGGLDRWALGLGKSAEKVDDERIGRAAKQTQKLADEMDRTPTGLSNALDRYKARLDSVFTVPIEAGRSVRSYLDAVDELERNLRERATGADPADLKRSQLDLADAQERLNEARKTGADATRAIRDAERDLADAERKAADAHFNGLRAGTDPERTRDADRAVEDARRRLEEARRVDAGDVARAELDVADAQRRVEELAEKRRRQPLLGTGSAEQRQTAEFLDRVLESLKAQVEIQSKAGKLPLGDPRQIRSMSDFTDATGKAKLDATSRALDDLLGRFPELRPQLEEVRARLDALKPAPITLSLDAAAKAKVTADLEGFRRPITVPLIPRFDWSSADPRLAGPLAPVRRYDQPPPANLLPQSTSTTTITNNTTVMTAATDPEAVASAIAREQARQAARSR